jgi:hypothetical protein
LVYSVSSASVPCLLMPSLPGHDAYFEPNQNRPARDLIQKLLTSATGPATEEHPKGQITPSDLSRFFSLRIAQSKRDNPVFSLSLLHRFFGASNASLLYEALGGDVAACTTVLLEERFPEGFETRLAVDFSLFPLFPLTFYSACVAAWVLPWSNSICAAQRLPLG